MFLFLDSLKSVNVRILLAACALSAACSGSKDKSIAIAATDEFHTRFNNSRFGDIYDSMEPCVSCNPKEDIIVKMESMHDAVGGVLQSKEVRVDYHHSIDGTVVKLCCEVTYKKAVGREEFVWVIANGKAVLRSFRAPSWPQPVC